MGSKAAYLRVGTLVAVGIAAIVLLAIFLGGDRIRHGRFFESYFRESVQGLEVGAAVKFRGVTLGKVTEIGLVATEYLSGSMQEAAGKSTSRLVFVRYELDPKRIGEIPDVGAAVASGLRARLASQGITGLTYVELDIVSPQRFPVMEVPWTPNVDYIPSMPSTLSQVQDAAQNLLAKLDAMDFGQISKSLVGLLEDLRAELATGDVRQTITDTDALVRSLDTQIAGADLPGLAASLRKTSGSIQGVVDGKPVKDLLSSAATAADRLAVASQKLPALIAALESTTHHADGGLSDLQAELLPLLRDARVAASNLRETSEVLRRYPAQFLLGGPPPRQTDR